MTRISALVTTMLLGLGAVAQAQPIDPYYSDDAPAADVDVDVQAATPPAEAPTYAPPPVQAQQAVPEGQWIYTQQYGWVWLPYGDQYVQSAGTTATAYVYYPTQGWVWLDAPWVLGVGVRPYFGHYGYAHYRWYPHRWASPRVYVRGGYYGGYGGYGRTYDHRPVYVAPRGGGWRGGAGWHGGGWHGGGPIIRGGGAWHGGAGWHGGGGWHGGHRR